jgi:hypothetical protein
MVRKHWQEALHDVSYYFIIGVYLLSYYFLSCEGPLYSNVAKLGACENKKIKKYFC